MIRKIKIGDTVQAFLNAAIKGRVTNVYQKPAKIWTTGGAPQGSVNICSVLVESSGKSVDILASELFIVDY